MNQSWLSTTAASAVKERWGRKEAAAEDRGEEIGDGRGRPDGGAWWRGGGTEEQGEEEKGRGGAEAEQERRREG